MAIQAGETTFYQAKRGIVQDGLVLNLDAAVDASYSGGTTWRDLAGGNNGTLANMNGTNLIKDNGGVFIFDGTNEHIQLPQSFSFGTSSFSIECWVKLDTISGIDAIYYSQSSNLSGFYGIGHANVTGARGFYISDFNGSTRVTSHMGTAASINTWYHVVGFKNTSNQQAVYVNGSLSTPLLTSTLSVTSSYPLIGANIASFSEIWDGSISQFRIYNRALTSDEIARNYNATRHRFGV
jgi:hypothetical protein